MPKEVYARLNARGRELADTDWHIDRLYAGLLPGATTVRAVFHRYVVDANRHPGGDSLYPGQNTTGLVPLTDFHGMDIWDDPPTENEIAERRRAYHAPYHRALQTEVERIRTRHGFAILYDCHSIRSTIPFLFDGQLPILNVGTNLSTTCDRELEAIVERHSRKATGFSSVINGRFKGGWTTRHYGRPDQGWHAIQMEIAQRAYLAEETAPWTFHAAKSDRLRAVLKPILADLSRWRPA